MKTLLRSQIPAPIRKVHPSLVLGMVITLILFSQMATNAQTIPPQVGGAWQRVYEQLPTFPKENQYLHKSTGAPVNSTLANRLIQYHVFVKGRSASSRIDWKFTLADYLGFNEVMYESRYPGVNELKTNPYESDRAIIQKLSPLQRDQLVLALVKALNPFNISQPKAESTPQPQVSPSPSQPPSLQLPKSPKAGDANLLKF